MSARSILTLTPLRRPYVDLGGGYQSARESLDFVVDGQRLSELLEGDLASRLAHRDPCQPLTPALVAPVVDLLLLRGKPDFAGGRYALYVCPECGDFGCGAVTAVIERNADTYVWRDFGWETDYDDEVSRDDFQHIGPFRFAAEQYERVLTEAGGHS